MRTQRLDKPIPWAYASAPAMAAMGVDDDLPVVEPRVIR